MSPSVESPLTLVQVRRWRVTRLIEMVERDYLPTEVVAELNSWLATGIERVPPTFDLAAAAARAVHARTGKGESLHAMLHHDEAGRLTGTMRDIMQTSIYAAVAPYLDRLDTEAEPLRSFQSHLDFPDTTQNPVTAAPSPADTVSNTSKVLHGDDPD